MQYRDQIAIRLNHILNCIQQADERFSIFKLSKMLELKNVSELEKYFVLPTEQKEIKTLPQSEVDDQNTMVTKEQEISYTFNPRVLFSISIKNKRVPKYLLNRKEKEEIKQTSKSNTSYY